jgi:NADH:ubiquinone oxidoreductase subunit E
MKEYIETNNLEDEIELKSAFCLGQCSKAVSVSVNGERIESIAPEDVGDFMRDLNKRDE